MAKAKVQIEFQAQTKDVAKNIATLEAHLKQLQERFKSSDIGSAQFKALGSEIRRVTEQIERASGAMKKMETLDAAAVLGKLGAEVAFIAGTFSSFIQKANEFNKSAQALRGEAKLMGVAFDSLSKVAEEVKTKYELSAKVANGYAVEVAKLATKAGDATKTQLAIGRLLDLAAAKGLDAEDALTAVKQALLGIDEGTDKLFGKNPSVLYEEYARAIGTTAAKLSDQQKAQALLVATMSEGAKVEGERLKYLQSAAGAQERYKQSLDELSASIGLELLKVLKPMLELLNEGLKILNQLDSNTVAATLTFIAFAYSIYQIVTALQAFRVALALSTGGLSALAMAIGGGLAAALVVASQNTDENEKSLAALEKRVASSKQGFNEIAAQMNVATTASSELSEELKKLNDEYDKLLKEKSAPKTLAEFDTAIKKQYDEVVATREKVERKMGGESVASMMNRRDVLERTVKTSERSLTDLSPEQKALSELNAILKDYEEANAKLLVLQKQRELFSLKKTPEKTNVAWKDIRAARKSGSPGQMIPFGELLSGSELAPVGADFSEIDARFAREKRNQALRLRASRAGEEGDIGALMMFRNAAMADALEARAKGDAALYEDALGAAKQIGEEIEKANELMVRGAQAYKTILAGAMSSVADAFGDQVAAALFSESFSIGQMFEGIAKQFVADIVSEFLKQEIASFFSSIIPGGGLLSLFGFADGGRPSMFKPNVVGERGAELFKPDAPGRVISSKEASSQLASMLNLFERPSAQADLSELLGLVSVQTKEVMRLRRELAQKEFIASIDGEKVNSRLKRVEKLSQMRIY